MLRKCFSILFAIVLFVSFILTVNGEKNMKNQLDSFQIEENIQNQIATKNTESVMRLYNVEITPAFSQYDNIYDILSSDHVLEICYVTTNSANQYQFFISKGNEMISAPQYTVNNQALQVCMEHEIIKNVDDEIVVNNVYYLSGESCHMGTAIYYITNKGNYVYYNHYTIGEYLFPVAAFCEYQKAVADEMIANGHLDGGVDLGEIWDLSPYDFKSDTFNLNANTLKNNPEPNGIKMLFIGVSVLAVLLITTIFCLRKIRTK
jgi:hypothetical protein